MIFENIKDTHPFFYEASVKLEWESMHNPKEVVPESQLYPPEENTSAGITGIPKIMIYPNPAKSNVTVECYNRTIYRINIYDIYGRKVLSSTEPVINRKTFFISHLKSGLYMIELNFGDQVQVLRLMK